jgi:hypothetical protein
MNTFDYISRVSNANGRREEYHERLTLGQLALP